MIELGFGLITCQRYPADDRTDVQLYAQALDLAEQSEQLGLDSVWVSEHHFVDDGYLPSLLPLCAAIAARTSRVRIGTGLVLAPLHDPLRLAEDLAVIDQLSGGRLDVGLAPGHKPDEFAARAVVEPFVRGYARGETPNPCTRCNGGFRFAELLTFARRAGAERLATGHYARIVERDGALLLARGADPAKDQSYMLAALDPRRLTGVSFPLGGQDKETTRAEAERAGLAAASSGPAGGGRGRSGVPRRSCHGRQKRRTAGRSRSVRRQAPGCAQRPAPRPRPAATRRPARLRLRRPCSRLPAQRIHPRRPPLPPSPAGPARRRQPVPRLPPPAAGLPPPQAVARPLRRQLPGKPP